MNAELADLVRNAIDDLGVEWEPGLRDGEFVVTLPGEKKLKTVTSVYRWLLQRNLRLPGLAYTIDASGDVYVTGRIPARLVDAAYVDQVLGGVLEAADGPFNDLLALGFLSSMKKEWAWRVSRGESLRNLEAFRALLDPDVTSGEPG